MGEPAEGRDVCDIFFGIQGGHLGTTISVVPCSQGQALTDKLAAPPGWTLQDNDSSALQPDGGPVPNAYKVLIEGVLRKHQAMFMSTEELLALWRIWTPIVDATESEPPKLYEPGFE